LHLYAYFFTGEDMTKDEALSLALEALEGVLDDSPKVLDASISGGLYEVVKCRDAITAIKAALEAKDEPWTPDDMAYRPDGLPQRTWVRITDEEIVLIVAECAASHQHTDIHFARAIEAKLRSKND
jgi:hypothetical protein